MEDSRVKVHDVAETVGISSESVHNILHGSLVVINIGSINSVVRMFRPNVYYCISAIHSNFCVDSWPMMILGPITTHVSLSNSQKNGPGKVNQLRKKQRQFHRLARLSPQFFWDARSITLLRGKSIKDEYYVNL